LKWDTYYDINDASFNILRATGTGTYTIIGTVPATGTPGQLTSKSYTDVSTPSGKVSYRISKISSTGCVMMSDSIELRIITGIIDNQILDSECKFYPNPFTVSGNLSLASENEETFSVSIFDITGKVLWSEDLSGRNIFTIGTQLSPGVYILTIIKGDAKKTIKVIKL
jgi:hypothetical protein